MSQKSLSSKNAPSVESLNWNDKGHGEMIEVINVQYFKKIACSFTHDHDFKVCFFFHNEDDKIRSLPMFPQLCPQISQQKKCQYSDTCPYCHNKYELLYHRQNFKKLFCPKRRLNCEFSNYCMHAHNEKEIQTNLIHRYKFDFDFFLFEFKTVWCPYALENHNQDKCVYAHSYNDFRRKPSLIDYKPEQCKEWNKKYNQCMMTTSGCLLSHNQFEVSYNPFFYKINPCPLMNVCTRYQNFCPYYHSSEDQRILTDNIKNGLTSFTSQNRILQNTFNKKLIKQRKKPLTVRSANHILVPNSEYKESRFKKQHMESNCSPQKAKSSLILEYDEDQTVQTIVSSILDD